MKSNVYEEMLSYLDEQSVKLSNMRAELNDSGAEYTEKLKSYRDLKNCLDAAREKGRLKGYAEGLVEAGRAKCHVEGLTEALALVIKDMLRLNMSISEIMESTELTEEEIRTLM